LVPRVKPKPQHMINARLVRMSICELHEMHAKNVCSPLSTYQEGLLSRRRLVFTHTQVYFQCLKTHACECIAGSYDSAHDVSNAYFNDP
jgi:hypothetical protein